MKSAILTIVILASLGVSAIAGNTDPIRSLLVGGTWTRHTDEQLFFRDGTCESHERGRQQATRGTWHLRGRMLSITEHRKTVTYRIISISKTHLELTVGNSEPNLPYNRYSE